MTSSDLFIMNLKQSMKGRESTWQYLKRLSSLEAREKTDLKTRHGT